MELSPAQINPKSEILKTLYTTSNRGAGVHFSYRLSCDYTAGLDREPFCTRTNLQEAGCRSQSVRCYMYSSAEPQHPRNFPKIFVFNWGNKRRRVENNKRTSSAFRSDSSDRKVSTTNNKSYLFMHYILSKSVLSLLDFPRNSSKKFGWRLGFWLSFDCSA